MLKPQIREEIITLSYAVDYFQKNQSNATGKQEEQFTDYI